MSPSKKEKKKKYSIHSLKKIRRNRPDFYGKRRRGCLLPFEIRRRPSW